MKKLLLLSPAVLLPVLFILGISCGKKAADDPVVATIGTEQIPLSVVNSFFDRMGTSFTSADEEYQAKRDALDSLIDYKLMVRGAYVAGLDKDPEVNQLADADKNEFMFDELYREEILPKVQVTDQEVDEFYNKLKTEFHVLHILLANKQEADSVEAELKKGVDFGATARAISLDQSSAVKGGDLGFVSWGTQTDPDFREAIFKLKPGEMSAPIQTQYGWHIIKVLESRQAENLAPEAKLAAAIRGVIQSRKETTVQTEFLDKIKDRAKVEINSEATQMLMDRLDQFFPKNLGGVERPDNYFPQVDLLKPFERQMVLASYQGGEVTVEDYLKKIGTVQEAYRPPFNDADSLKKVIFQLELRNILEFEAEQRKVEDRPEYQKRMNDFKEGIMHDKFQRSVLGRNLDVSQDEITQYYNSHLEDFTTPPEYHLQEIEVDSSLLASRISEQLANGADFGKLATEYTIRTGVKQSKGDIGFVSSMRAPKLYDAARTLVKGQVSGVVQNDEGKFSIIKLLDTKAAVIPPVEEVASQVKQKVLDLKRTNVTLDWLKEQRAKADIKVNEDVLRQSIDNAKYAKND